MFNEYDTIQVMIAFKKERFFEEEHYDSNHDQNLKNKKLSNHSDTVRNLILLITYFSFEFSF